MVATGRSLRGLYGSGARGFGLSQLAPLRLSALHRPIVGMRLFVVLGARATEEKKDRLTIFSHDYGLTGLNQFRGLWPTGLRPMNTAIESFDSSNFGGHQSGGCFEDTLSTWFSKATSGRFRYLDSAVAAFGAGSLASDSASLRYTISTPSGSIDNGSSCTTETLQRQVPVSNWAKSKSSRRASVSCTTSSVTLIFAKLSTDRPHVE
jgi:hypothetical protein